MLPARQRRTSSGLCRCLRAPEQVHGVEEPRVLLLELRPSLEAAGPCLAGKARLEGSKRVGALVETPERKLALRQKLGDFGEGHVAFADMQRKVAEVARGVEVPANLEVAPRHVVGPLQQDLAELAQGSVVAAGAGKHGIVAELHEVPARD